MTLYKLIQPGETIPENAVYFWDGQTLVKSPFAGREYDSKRHVRHFIPVEVPDEKPAPAPQAEEIPLGPEDVPPGSVFRFRGNQASWWACVQVVSNGVWISIGHKPKFYAFYKLSDFEISRNFGKTWQPCRKVSKAAEPVWHNPDGVPMDKIPEEWRLMVPAEVDGRHKRKCRVLEMNRWVGLGRAFGDEMDYTYIVPADTPLPTEA